MSDFDSFWDAYPRRIAKKDAQKAWAALKVDDAMAGRIMALLKERITGDWCQKTLDGTGSEWIPVRYIPYPGTWLRSEDFDDRDEVEALEDDHEELPLFRAVERVKL